MIDLPAAQARSGSIFLRFSRTVTESNACQAIREIGTNALPTLIHFVRDPDSWLETGLRRFVRKQSQFKLKSFSAEQRRLQAFAALIQLGSVAVPAWSELLLDQNLPIKTRQVAASCLGRPLTNNAEAAASALFRCLMHEPEHLGKTASDSLYRIGPESAVPVLIQNLSSPDPLARSNAAVVLAGFGTKAESAVSALLNRVEDNDDGVRTASRIALRNCEPDAVLSLTRSLKYDPPSFRAGAASSLGLLKQKAEIAIPALIQALNDDEMPVRRAAASALGRYGAEAQPAVSALLKACGHTNKHFRTAATNALEQIQGRR